jgi:hypothetical protein
MPLVCLDTNAFNNLTWRGAEDKLEALQTRLKGPNCPHVLIVGTLLDELAPMLLDPRAEAPTDRARRMLDFLLGGVKVRMLFQPRERIQAEIDAALSGAARPLWKCLQSVADTRAMIRHHMGSKQTIEEVVRLAKDFEPAIAEERATRLEILETAPPEFDIAGASLETLIDWEVKRRLGQGGYRLPSDESLWPASLQIPTLRYFWSVVWAYRYLNIAEPKRVERTNDLPDLLTYRDAAYADVFVTDDGRLRTYLERCPEPKARLQRFAEWARTV